MNVDPLIRQLLRNRGIESEEDVIEFLAEKPQRTYDPFLLPDMEAGVDLILSEIEKGTKICVYGDYDADGITATTLMLTMLGHLTSEEKLGYYVPSRFEEGYGLNKDAIQQIADAGFGFIVTVDCGSVSVEEVDYALSLGLKIMVTDHHVVTGATARCILVNPKRPDSGYPFRDLAGVGVAFKLAQALQKKSALPKSVLTEVLDLVAIGTIGDIMPLLDENRTMVKFGLRVLNLSKRPGLKKLIDGTSLKAGQISAGNVSFVIVPHLNASGRIEDASQAVELLLGRCPDEELDYLVDDVLQKNAQRKALQSELFDKLKTEVDPEAPADFIILEADAGYEGVAGIVAGKIKDAFYRPSVIVSPTGDEGVLKGTGRSIEGVNLYEVLKTQEELFLKFGGHAGACGFSIKREDLPRLREGANQVVAGLKQIDDEIFRRKYKVELELDADRLTLPLAEQIEMLAPFGSGNPRPLIYCGDATISEVRYMGASGQHVRFMAEGAYGNRVLCVLFNKAKDYDFAALSRGRASMVGNIQCNVWQGAKRLQFLVDEIQIDER